MSIGPVAGSGIPITLPYNKLIFWSALAQSLGNQFLQIKDSSGTVMMTAQGASSSGGTPTQIGQGVFQATDSTNNYTVWLGLNGGSSYSNVVYNQDVLSIGANIYAGKFIFSTEDSGDNDYNDSYLQLQWFQYEG